MASMQVLLLAAAAIAVLCLVPQASAEVYTVGDSAGWTLKYPSSWTDVFTFTASKHTVVEVTGAGFKACDMTGNEMLGSWKSGSDTIKLDKAGRRWFVYGVGNHCDRGMKLLVITVDSKACSATFNYNAGVGAVALVAGAAAALLF